jgi:hypothetical protein
LVSRFNSDSALSAALRAKSVTKVSSELQETPVPSEKTSTLREKQILERDLSALRETKTRERDLSWSNEPQVGTPWDSCTPRVASSSLGSLEPTTLSFEGPGPLRRSCTSLHSPPSPPPEVSHLHVWLQRGPRQRTD